MGRKVPTSSTSAPAPAPASRKTAANSTNRRIVIVGGGVIGACCAYYLRQKGFTNIVIVEKESIACAASGKAAGFLSRTMCRDTPAIRNLSRASYDLHVQLAKQLNGQRNYGFRHVSPFAISFNEVQGSGVWGTHERAKWSTEDGGHLEEVLSDEEKNEEEEDWDEEDRELKNNNLHFAVEDGSDLLLSPQQLEQEEVEVVMDDKRSYFSSLADPPLDEHYTNHSSPHQTLPACNDTSALEMKEIPSNEQEVQGTKTEINTSSTDPPPHLQNSFYHDDDGSIIDSVINDVMQSVFSTPKVDISGQQRVSSPLQPHFAPPLPTTTGTLGSAASVKYSGLEFPFAAGIGDGSVSTIPTGSTSSLCSNMIETLSYASSFASISTSSSSSSLSSRTNSPAEKMYTSCSSAATTSSTALASSFINQDVNFSLNDYHYNNCSTSASFYSSSSSISALPLMMSGDGGGTVIRDSLSFFVRDAAYCGGGGGIDPNCLSSSSTPSSVNSSSASSPNTKGLGGNNSNANSPNSPHGSIEVLPTQHARPPPQALHNSTTTTTTTSSLSASSSSASSLRTTIKGSSSKIPCWLDESLIKRSNALGTIDEAAQCHPLYFTRKLVRESGARIIFGTAVDTIVVQEKVKSVIIKVSSSFGGSAAADKKNNHNTSSSSCYSPPPPPPFKEKLVRLDCDEVILACGPWTAETLESMNLDIIGEFKGHLANSVVLSTPCDTVASKMSQAIFGDIRVDGEWREVEMYPRPDSTVYLYGNPRYEEEEALDPTYSFRPPSNPADISAIGNKFISSTTISDMVDLAKTVAPCLLYERVLATQACYLPSSPDRAPVIGKMPGLSNLFMATGHSCWGILLAPGTGLAIAEMIADHISATHSTVCDMSPFLPSRFRVRKRRKRAIGGTSLSPSSRRRVDKTALSKTRITSTITDSIGSSTSGAGSEGDGDDVIQEDSAAASGGDVQSYAYWLTSQGGCGNRTGGVASAAVGEKRKLLELESDKDMINNSDHNNSSSSISNDTKRPRYNSVVVGQMYDENGRLKPISLLAAGSSISSSTTHK